MKHRQGRNAWRPTKCTDRTRAGWSAGRCFDPSSRAWRSIPTLPQLIWAHGRSQRRIFLWLHFSLTNAASERWLRLHAALPAAFYDSLREDSSSTRIEVVDGALLAVINDVQFFAAEASSVATVALCVTRHPHRQRQDDASAGDRSAAGLGHARRDV